MKFRFVAALVLLIVIGSAGCVMSSLSGAHYLQHEEYDQGIRSMKETLAKNPNDSSANYYLGRMYMGKKETKQALPYFEKAIRLDPDNADYHFWRGVALWALLDFDGEQKAYLKTIALDERYISAHLYLGHNYLDRGEWNKALVEYDRVIELDPNNPEALYNRGEALFALGKRSEAREAWLHFMEAYPDGLLAFRATKWLNQLGDFTYRNFLIGQRNITLRVPSFREGATGVLLDNEAKPSLSVLGAMLNNNRMLQVHVVTFDADGVAKAKREALLIRDYIVRMWPEVSPSRLHLSWFGEGETVDTADGPTVIDQTVKFITVTEEP